MADVSHAEQARLLKQLGILGDAPFMMDCTVGLRIDGLRSHARTQHRKTPLAAIFVDYIQFMANKDEENSNNEIGRISNGLKLLARELQIPVVALSQLNRGLETRQDKRPQMSDLRASGDLEQDADVIAFIYREEFYAKEKTTADKVGVAELNIAKHRNGPVGGLELRFAGRYPDAPPMFMNLEKRR